MSADPGGIMTGLNALSALKMAHPSQHQLGHMLQPAQFGAQSETSQVPAHEVSSAAEGAGQAGELAAVV